MSYKVFTLEDTVMLSWKKACAITTQSHLRYRAQPAAASSAQPRLLGGSEGGGQAESLLGLTESVSGVALGRSIAELQALYDRLVWVDSAAEAQAFLGEVRSTQ